MTTRQPRTMRGQETITLAGERLIYTVRRSRKAKQLLLHVHEDGQVEVVVPWWAPMHQATRLVRDKHRWLRRHLAARAPRPPRLSWRDGSAIPYFDERLILRLQYRRERQRATAVRRGTELHIVVPAHGSLSAALEAWYARQARLFFTQAAEAATAQLGVAVRRVAVGNHRTQWGSCSAKGRLSFNWRLLLGPRWVADYVVAHEVAHLVHHNHSARYWAVVKTLYPDYQRARRWLRENASQLRW